MIAKKQFFLIVILFFLLVLLFLQIKIINAKCSVDDPDCGEPGGSGSSGSIDFSASDCTGICCIEAIFDIEQQTALCKRSNPECLLSCIISPKDQYIEECVETTCDAYGTPVNCPLNETYGCDNYENGGGGYCTGDGDCCNTSIFRNNVKNCLDSKSCTHTCANKQVGNYCGWKSGCVMNTLIKIFEPSYLEFANYDVLLEPTCLNLNCSNFDGTINNNQCKVYKLDKALIDSNKIVRENIGPPDFDRWKLNSANSFKYNPETCVYTDNEQVFSILSPKPALIRAGIPGYFTYFSNSNFLMSPQISKLACSIAYYGNDFPNKPTNTFGYNAGPGWKELEGNNHPFSEYYGRWSTLGGGCFGPYTDPDVDMNFCEVAARPTPETEITKWFDENIKSIFNIPGIPATYPEIYQLGYFTIYKFSDDYLRFQTKLSIPDGNSRKYLAGCCGDDRFKVEEGSIEEANECFWDYGRICDSSTAFGQGSFFSFANNNKGCIGEFTANCGNLIQNLTLFDPKKSKYISDGTNWYLCSNITIPGMESLIIKPRGINGSTGEKKININGKDAYAYCYITNVGSELHTELVLCGGKPSCAIAENQADYGDGKRGSPYLEVGDSFYVNTTGEWMTCTEDGTVKADLDDKTLESSCKGSGFLWTDSYCCSEADDVNETYNDYGNSYNTLQKHLQIYNAFISGNPGSYPKEQQTGTSKTKYIFSGTGKGGCFLKNDIKSGETLSEAKNIPDTLVDFNLYSDSIINYKGIFYGCMYDRNVSYIPKTECGSHTQKACYDVYCKTVPYGQGFLQTYRSTDNYCYLRECGTHLLPPCNPDLIPPEGCKSGNKVCKGGDVGGNSPVIGLCVNQSLYNQICTITYTDDCISQGKYHCNGGCLERCCGGFGQLACDDTSFKLTKGYSYPSDPPCNNNLVKCENACWPTCFNETKKFFDLPDPGNMSKFGQDQMTKNVSLIMPADLCTTFEISASEYYYCDFNQRWVFSKYPRSYLKNFPWKPEETISTTYSYKGCCGVSECWNGKQCVSSNDYTKNIETHNGTEYYCYNPGTGANWITGLGLYDWDMKEQGFCAKQGQCYVGPYNPAKTNPSDWFTNDKPKCINNTAYILDHYCDNGNWTTRTRLIADKFIKLGTGDFEVYCDKIENVIYLDSYKSGSTGQYLQVKKNSVDKYLTNCKIDNQYPCLNNFCVLIKDNGVKAIGVSSNLNGTKYFISNITNGTAPGYSFTDKKNLLYFYSNDNLDFQGTSFGTKIRDIWTTIRTFFLNLFGANSGCTNTGDCLPESILNITRFHDFNNVYYVKEGTKEIFGAKEKVYRKDGSGERFEDMFVVKFENYADVCESANKFIGLPNPTCVVDDQNEHIQYIVYDIEAHGEDYLNAYWRNATIMLHPLDKD